MRIEFNIDGFKELRSSPGVVSELESRGQRIVDAANARGKGTYAMGSRQGAARPQGRWRVSVVTADARAMVDNAKYQTLVRLLGGGA